MGRVSRPTDWVLGEKRGILQKMFRFPSLYINFFCLEMNFFLVSHEFYFEMFLKLLLKNLAELTLWLLLLLIKIVKQFSQTCVLSVWVELNKFWPF